MLHKTVNGWDMPYIEVGRGPTLLCIHGSLGDFRVWGPVLGPLSQRHRVVAPSLRHFFPGRRGEVPGPFTIAQHVADVVAFIETLGAPVDLMGHSRGGHIAFRVAQQRPDLLRRLVLAEPGGTLDESLAASPAAGGSRSHVEESARKIAAGDIDGGLTVFIDAIDGPGAWTRRPPANRQRARDNAYTLVQQIDEQRQAFTRRDAEQIKLPTLFIGGAATTGMLPQILKALAGHVPGARMEMIPDTTHNMFDQDPERFCPVVLRFLEAA